MLVFLSDIHFSDKSIAPPNVPASAFQGAYESIAQMAKDAGAERLEIIFLGDVFDLIRTDAWQQFNEEDRPWGQDDGKWTEGQDKATLTILDAVAKANEQALAVLAGSPHPNTKRTFIPGNHDRPVNLSPQLRKRVSDLLGLGADPEKRFDHYYFNASARVFARHGHEFDKFNFGGSETFDHDKWVDIPQSDYDKTPIGDLLAAELSSLLPKIVLGHLGGVNANPELYDRLKDLFDVRPTTAMLDFLGYQIRNFNDAQVTGAINKGFREAVQHLQSLSYVKRWIAEKRRWFHPFDEAEVLKLLLFLGENIDLKELGVGLKAYEWISRFQSDDNLASNAADDFRRLDNSKQFVDPGIDFVLYGHTHEPEQRLIKTRGQGTETAPRMYLNTGMWRPLHNQGLSGGFASWDTLCYTTIYEPGEKWKKSASSTRGMFEVWTGGLERD